jgi:hypothetical protein
VAHAAHDDGDDDQATAPVGIHEINRLAELQKPASARQRKDQRSRRAAQSQVVADRQKKNRKPIEVPALHRTTLNYFPVESCLTYFLNTVSMGRSLSIVNMLFGLCDLTRSKGM